MSDQSETFQEPQQVENPVETPQPAKNDVVGQPEASAQPVHESIAEAIIKIIPQAEQVSAEVLNLARLVEAAIKSHLASHGYSQAALSEKNELAAKLNPQP